MEPRDITAPAPTVVTRRKTTPKAVKEIRSTLVQMDEALRLQDLGAKQRVEILAQKAKLLTTLLSYEREAEEDEREIEQTREAAKIAELTQQVSISAAKVTELTEANARLRTLSEQRKIEYVPDPKHEDTKRERDALRDIIRSLVTSIPDPQRVETIVTAAVKLFPSCPKIGEIILDVSPDLKWLQWLPQFMSQDRWNLERQQGAADKKIARLAEECFSVRFPQPVKNPGMMSPEERLADAKKQVRGL